MRNGLQGSGRPCLEKPFRRGAFMQIIDQALNLTVKSTHAVSLVLSDPALHAEPVLESRPKDSQVQKL